MKTKPFRDKKINIVTLGCSKNLVDSEYLMGQLVENKFTIEHNSDKTDARIVIINTCGFINDAKQESIDTILQYAKAKNEGLIDHLFVMGCLAERYKSALQKEIVEVDSFFGVNSVEQILKYLGVNYKKELIGERFLTTPKHYAYLKISEGCDRNCSFCSIPIIRGKHISRSEEDIIAEAEGLVKKGVKEIMLIAQDLTYYGIDLYKEQRLTKLVRKISEIKGVEWLRLHYAYPAKFPKDLIYLMKEKSNICKYIDIPFQHISNPMLYDMRRAIDKKTTFDLIHFFRAEIPEIAIRTTFLVGYPNETEKDFEELKQFIKESRFERLGVFTYSHEEDTYSYKYYKDNVKEEIKKARASEIMEIQQEISQELNLEKIGKVYKVLVDRVENDYYVARTEFDSPEVDNEVLIPKALKKLKTGSFYSAKITGATEFDLFAEITD
jgi:ribosomal protein S12 methylthiotransferase